MSKAKGGKNNRKIGRNAKYCLRYKLSKRREHNKIIRLNKHIKKFVNDKCAIETINRYKIMIKNG